MRADLLALSFPVLSRFHSGDYEVEGTRDQMF